MAPRKSRSKPAEEEVKRVVPPRLSISMEPDLRRKIRIAAARADLEIGEWCKAVLSAAAKKTVEKLYGDEA